MRRGGPVGPTIHSSGTNRVCGLYRQLLIHTDDNAADGASLLDVSGLLCKHTLPPLEQGNVALDIISVGDLAAAAVRLSHSHKAPHLHADTR